MLGLKLICQIGKSPGLSNRASNSLMSLERIVPTYTLKNIKLQSGSKRFANASGLRKFRQKADFLMWPINHRSNSTLYRARRLAEARPLKPFEKLSKSHIHISENQYSKCLPFVLLSIRAASFFFTTNFRF